MNTRSRLFRLVASWIPALAAGRAARDLLALGRDDSTAYVSAYALAPGRADLDALA